MPVPLFCKTAVAHIKSFAENALDVQSQRVVVGVRNKALGFILEAKADVLIRGEAG
jgi:hypothetical protein